MRNTPTPSTARKPPTPAQHASRYQKATILPLFAGELAGHIGAESHALSWMAGAATCALRPAPAVQGIGRMGTQGSRG